MRIPEIIAFERLSEPLATRQVFAGRLVRSIVIGGLIVAAALFGGMAGYHVFEGLAWIDAFVNAAMILSGMGVLAAPVSVEGKLFAGLYAIFCGLVLIAATAIMFTPVIHRFLHQMHMDDEDDA
ncbi:hypothetical protein [Fluviibacter phosphoraccumulans]|uniref:Uncharacterized protein n=1 Tax=Fluviibacter phosphoraccumulans TaxID=1751046 RepID=A0A679HST3_9RHOO|nr:hypothetical protein [Fluviibacter phosphoraccumulans]BBU69410.1 hypothetical protein ICHIAU1_16930 [Fluviibacter phosphoraccumulans]BBU71408.1 hypothetical protein ICHIJ1_13270 [Fluviibacter phosphoraccumulans]BCA65346.1 hypothetical protein SHINM1_009480 [Fluviibacter phosphoraccumulans]